MAVHRGARTSAGAVEAWTRAGATLATVLALDQALKQLAVASLERGVSENVFFGIDLNLVRNTGVAFGAFANTGALVMVLTAVALVVLIGYFARHATRRGLWLPVGMLLGGALGNLADRVREGSVIDFIDPVLWPAFNLGDACIVLGVLGLLYVVEGDDEGKGGG
jgi:signal peptidase II